MNPSMISRRPRWAPILVVVALAAVAIVAVRSLREPVLRAAGWALVVNEPVAPADIIVVSPDSGGLANDIIGLVREGTKKWTRTRKAEERNPASRSYRASRMTRERGVSFKEAADVVR